jgi:outer membrane protein assembly factor BamB
MILRHLFFAGLLAASMPISHAENWPVWRGPRGDGTSLDKNPPIQWSATSNVVWKTAVPGEGHSSPIIWNDRIFLTTAFQDTQERALLSFDRASGKLLWQQTVLKAPLEAKNPENSYASSSVATDGKLLFTTFLDVSNVVVTANDFSGKQAWQVRPGLFYSQHGFSHTPVLFEDKVIIVCYSKGENFIVALNQADGKVAWKVQGENPTQSYSAPLIREMAGRMQMVVAGNRTVTSYDPRTGRKLWFYTGHSEDSVVTAVYNEKTGLVLTSSSWPKKVLVAIKPDGEGDITATKVAWKNESNAPYVPSPISVGDWFFTCSFSGRETCCLDAATGNLLWKEKTGAYHASPVVSNGLVYFLNDDGVMTVVKAGPKFELAARNELGEKTYASPAICDGQIFLRTAVNLYCIGAKP